MNYAYHVYGLDIASDIELPEVDESARGSPAVEIRKGVVEDKPDVPNSASWGCYRATSNAANLYYPQIGYISISNGRRMCVESAKRTHPALVRHTILTSAMSILLDQRGHLTFNGSAVNIDGKAVAFLGGRHAGKTAIATAFYLQGHPLVTDDTVVLHEHMLDTVLPGYARMKLRPETVQHTTGLNGELIDDFTGHRKLMWADKGFTARPLPLRHIFVLDWGDEFEVEHVSLRESFMLLIQHSYALRFLGKAGATAKHFTRVNQLVHSVPISYLRKPRDIDRIPELIDLVISELNAGSRLHL